MPLALLQGGRVEHGRVATKWLAKAMFSLKQSNGIHWYHFHLHISHKAINAWPNSSAIHVNYSQLSACKWDMQPFEGDPNTHGRLNSLRNKPQETQPGQLSASIPA